MLSTTALTSLLRRRE